MTNLTTQNSGNTTYNTLKIVSAGLCIKDILACKPGHNNQEFTGNVRDRYRQQNQELHLANNLFAKVKSFITLLLAKVPAL